jgi:hypothetical protein
MMLESALQTAESCVSNVIRLALRVTPGDIRLLERWVSAGGPMGLCDAMAYPPSGDGPRTDHVLVWVRENPNPAYMVTPDGFAWCVTDCVRNEVLARLRSFEAALNFIRPVLPPRHVAA